MPHGYPRRPRVRGRLRGGDRGRGKGRAIPWTVPGYPAGHPHDGKPNRRGDTGNPDRRGRLMSNPDKAEPRYTTTPAIAVEGLSKRFGSVQAVAGVGFEGSRGEFFCFLG